MADLVLSFDGIEIWHGNSLDRATVETIMAGRVGDLLHVDAPYSARTHEGHRKGKLTADRATSFAGRRGSERSDLEYKHWTPEDVQRFGASWLSAIDGWATTITDHVLAPAWSEGFEGAGLYAFPPLPWVEVGSRVRMVGDGPSSWSYQVIVARPRREPWSTWGCLRGAYIGPGENQQNRPDRITGGKSLRLTCDLVCDYSRRGHLVVDPALGGGTTALACRMTGRRCIGIEVDHTRAELCARLVRDRREQLTLGGVA